MNDPDAVTRRYRDLPREEPSEALDAAILAASRRAVAPRRRASWVGPVSIAAVLVLGIGVSLRMQREEPGVEVPSAQSRETRIAPVEAIPAPQSAASAPSPALATPPPPAPKAKIAAPRAQELESRRRDKPDTRGRTRLPEDALQDLAPLQAPAAPFGLPAPMQAAPAYADRNAAPARDALQDRAAIAHPPAAESPGAGATAKSTAPQAAEEKSSVPTTPVAAAPPPSAAAAAAAPAPAARALVKSERVEPQTELERIALLRAAGRDAEADRALEEFRRAHPGFVIAEPMWQRVKPR